MTQLCQKWLIKPGPSAALINKEENLLQAHYNSIHSIIKSIPVLTLRSVRSWKKRETKTQRWKRGGGGGGFVCVAAGRWVGGVRTRQWPCTEHPSVPYNSGWYCWRKVKRGKKAGGEKGKKKEWESVTKHLPLFFCSNCFHACIVPTHKQ